MAAKDYYTTLGVDEKASSSQIKAVYRKLALKYHPDRVSEAEKSRATERFKEIAAAYYTLGDAKRRKEYDDYRKGAEIFRSGHGSGDFASQSGFDFDDLMKYFHGPGPKAQPRKREGSSRYFFFNDLSDIFEGVSGVSGGSSDMYGGYSFADEEPAHKHDTDIHANLTIPRSIALNGGDVKFKLKDNRTITLKIAKNTKNGRKLRLKGLGKRCPCCDHNGDFIVVIALK
jgi:DnaJ-class molecular chaperone